MTSEVPSLKDVVRCNKCGFCQEVCPTYKVTGQEFALARGRNRLLRLVMDDRISLDADPELKEHLYSCLLCGACTLVCPPAVPTDKLVAAARALLTSRQGLPFWQRRVLRGFLKSPRHLAVPISLLRLYQRSGMRWLARHTGLLRLLGNLERAEGLLPPLPAASLRARLALRRGGAVSGELAYQSRACGSSPAWRKRVAYFAGCLSDNLFANIGMAVIGVLEKNGYQVVVPHNLCCGIAHQAYGDLEVARDLARANVRMLLATGAELVVSECGSCAHTLHGYAELLADDPTWSDAAGEVAAKVRDVSQLLVEEGYREPGGRVEEVATYHDPCHLARGLGVRAAPRAVLKSIPGLELRELPEADWCCGGAGSYNVTRPDLSMAILDRKMANVRETGATLLTSGCPSCLVQLAYGLGRAGLTGRVEHPLQLVWRAYQNGER